MSGALEGFSFWSFLAGVALTLVVWVAVSVVRAFRETMGR